MPPVLCLSRQLPRYVHHNATGRAVVYLGGKALYFGPFGSPLSETKCKRVAAD